MPCKYCQANLIEIEQALIRAHDSVHFWKSEALHSKIELQNANKGIKRLHRRYKAAKNPFYVPSSVSKVVRDNLRGSKPTRIVPIGEKPADK